MLYYVYFIKVEYDFYNCFWKFQTFVQSLNSPMFENLLLGDDLCEVF